MILQGTAAMNTGANGVNPTPLYVRKAGRAFPVTKRRIEALLQPSLDIGTNNMSSMCQAPLQSSFHDHNVVDPCI